MGRGKYTASEISKFIIPKLAKGKSFRQIGNN